MGKVVNSEEMRISQLNWDAEKYQNQYNFLLSGIAAVNTTTPLPDRVRLESVGWSLSWWNFFNLATSPGIKGYGGCAVQYLPQTFDMIHRGEDLADKNPPVNILPPVSGWSITLRW